MQPLPEHDEVHVVSDLHMGGPAGFQILRETQRLANFIDRLTGLRPKSRLALVLNGDVFDTLAEDIAGYVAVDEAAATVTRIMDDPAFAPVWAALAGFARTPGRTLVFVIGNHDIEIALPPVQRLLNDRLAGADLEARARIVYSTTGAGYLCSVGGATVYCIHGNEVDGWNYNRYEDLARVGRRLNAGMPFTQAEWQPNAGTRMVKEVMNEVKQKYAWIDLLKPETSAAVGALLVLDPGQARKIDRLFGIVSERFKGNAQVDARLSADADAAPDASAAAAGPGLDQMLGANLRQVLGEGSGEDVDAMLLAAEQQHATPRAARAADDSTLGLPGLIVDRLTGWLTGVSKAEALRRALRDWLAKDKSFEIEHEDETYVQVSRSVGASIDFIVTGHTHLERAIDMGQGRCYFNCGTWIRLLRFSDAMLENEASFNAVYGVLTKGRMHDIDTAHFGGQPFVMDQSGAVCIRVEHGRVVGELTHVEGDGTGAPRVLKRCTRG